MELFEIPAILTSALPGSSILTANGSYNKSDCSKKGCCRKCGVVAYGKRKCERCSRKFCSACAPSSLQKYGDETWEECCVGCEPHLLIPASPESEPIFEMEPDDDRIGPLHVPLSEMSAESLAMTTIMEPLVESIAKILDLDLTGNNSCQPKEVSPTNSTRTCSTDSESNLEEEEDDEFESIGRWLTRGLTTMTFQEPELENKGEKKGHFFPARKLSKRKNVDYSDNVLPEQPPRTPDPGCCTACNKYASGKEPCQGCGTKYCEEPACQAYLDGDDGTCAKCCIRAAPTILNVREPEEGCCTACLQYSSFKFPCENCGTKYCQETSCQDYMFLDEGTCVVCREDEGRWNV